MWNPLHSRFWPSLSRRSRWRAQVRDVVRQTTAFEKLPSLNLRRRLEALAWEARGGRPLAAMMSEVFAIVAVASKRSLGYSHYPVQVMGAIALFEGFVIEMQTGEGKTLTSTMPVVLRALPGHGCHVVTSNNYLAGRDAEHMGKVYAELGLTCGCVLDELTDDDRHVAYDCDITYGTAPQFGFDFLRDRLKSGTSAAYESSTGTFSRPHPQAVQRGHYCAIVDEADSVMIDDAVTPLVIGLEQENTYPNLGLYAWCREMAGELRPDEDFIFELEKRRAVLTEEGCRRVLLTAKPPALDAVHAERIYEHVEQALFARVGLLRNRDYVIDDGEVVIVGESLGRKMQGRKWQRGLHQMVESKERLEITQQTVHAAQITVQTFFRQYRHLAGMTGTAVAARSEFRKVFRVPVSVIPTHRPCRRAGLAPRIFRTTRAKYQAATESIIALRDQGRAILVGTPSVAESEALSAMLMACQVDHQVLNAHQDHREADIIAQAGKSRQVTIATNMAGRGTDILIDEAVRSSGGLHVIATAMHTAARIDRQLVGRAARQGDPGSFQFFVSLEDPLLHIFSQWTQRRLMRISQQPGMSELASTWIRVFRRAQRRHERHERKQRKELLKSEEKRNESYQKMGLDPYVEFSGDD